MYVFYSLTRCYLPQKLKWYSLYYTYYTNDASSKDFFSFFSVKKQICFFGEKGMVEDDVKEPIFVAHNKMSDQDPERVHGDQTMLYKAPPRI